MKRIVLAMCVAAGMSSVYAQTQNLELRRSDMSYPGQSFQYQEDTSVVLPGNFSTIGKNQRWDFSVLDNNYAKTTKFLAPNANNGGDGVDDCNLVIQDDDQFDEFTYINASDSALTALNNSLDTTEASAGFKPRMMLFPLTYGMAWADSSRNSTTYTGAEFGVPIDSIRVEVYIIINNSCDGQGQLILPVDSVEAYRVKQDLFYEYTVTGYSAITGWFPIQSGSEGQITYVFLSKNGGYFAATVSPKNDQAGVADVTYRSSSVLSVKNPVNGQPATLYPNPAQNHFQIEAKQAGTMQIFDVQGKLVQSNVSIEAGTNLVETSSYKAGQYLVVILYQDGTSSVNRIVRQ